MAWGRKSPIRANGKGSKRHNARTRAGLVWTVTKETSKPEWIGPHVKPRDGRPEWNDAITGPIAALAAAPAYYREPSPIPLDVAAVLDVGGAVVAAFDLCLSPDRGVYPFAPLVRYFGDPANPPIKQGSLLMYTGQIRVTERRPRPNAGFHSNNKDLTVRVMKHTFITPMGRCIVHDLDLLRPA